MSGGPSITCHPVTPDRWADLEALFGPRGAVGGCWCMFFRLPSREFEANKGEANRRAMQGIVERGEVPGILAYVDGQPAGWCSIAPREAFPRLERSRVAKRVDDLPVWSVVCFFVQRPYRRQGVGVALLEAAVEYARSQGAHIIEAYPVEAAGDMPDVYAYYGLAETFRRAGFVEVARRSPTRPLMRLTLTDAPGVNEAV
ncbi:MAG: GNAT family N-acetyltransferase [Anaerolineae bacterium]